MSIARNNVFDRNLFLVSLQGREKSKKAEFLITWLKTFFFLKFDLEHNEQSPKWRFRRELFLVPLQGLEKSKKSKIW